MGETKELTLEELDRLYEAEKPKWNDEPKLVIYCLGDLFERLQILSKLTHKDKE